MIYFSGIAESANCELVIPSDRFSLINSMVVPSNSKVSIILPDRVARCDEVELVPMTSRTNTRGVVFSSSSKRTKDESGSGRGDVGSRGITKYQGNLNPCTVTRFVISVLSELLVTVIGGKSVDAEGVGVWRKERSRAF